MRFCLRCFVAFIVTCGALCPVFGVDNEVPVVVWASYPAGPGDHVILHGGDWGVNPHLVAGGRTCEAVVLSDLPVLHEVYGEAGTYIDPRGDAAELPPLKKLSGEEKRALLERFSWERSAKIMLDTVLGRAG